MKTKEKEQVVYESKNGFYKSWFHVGKVIKVVSSQVNAVVESDS